MRVRPAFLFTLVLGTILVSVYAPAGRADDSATPRGVSLEVIMANPDWIGRQPKEAWWSWDGETIYFERKHPGETYREFYRIAATGGEAVKLSPQAAAEADAPGVINSEGTRLAFVRNGDIFLRNLETGALQQVTRTAANEANVFFLANGHDVAWNAKNDFFFYRADEGLIVQAAAVKTKKDPLKEEKEFDYLEAQQKRLFSTLRETKEEEQNETRFERQQRAADPTRVPPPFFLGDKVEIIAGALSPALNYLVVVTREKQYEEGKDGTMPRYVARSGYVETEAVRTLVGENPPAPHTVWVLDLEAHKRHKLDLSTLPGIKDDPLAELREQALAWHVDHGAKEQAVEKALQAPDVRSVQVYDIKWSRDGRQVAIGLLSIDNKDRWIAGVAFEDDFALQTRHRLTDPAWVNYYFNAFGWLPDGEALWYLSEESGYSHLYLKPVGGDARRLTEGAFEVSSPQVARHGDFIYFIANKQHPGWYDIYRVPINGGEMQRLTQVGVEPAARQEGWSRPYRLSPDESRVLFHNGTTTRPPELYVQSIAGSGDALRLTHTISEEYRSLPWTEPKIVEVPSSHVDRPIYSRLYLPPDYDPAKRWPAVVFVHGAGYLQNAHYGWSHYFREFMFNSLLNLHGYVVLDMDYRASYGYGRDWRTAIYQRMGHPELEDLQDGVAWLVENYNVDPQRVGTYGGSYGGFMTFMALFRAPDLFAAGAALRPVTDWAHYNHGYTSNILNTPLLDPMAYERSSPIEFAQNYANTPMLIAHGMEDDNVFFKDSVRLVQRLIELEKENFEIAIFPLDPHGFVHPASWLNEYRRIFKLFEAHVKGG